MCHTKVKNYIGPRSALGEMRVQCYGFLETFTLVKILEMFLCKYSHFVKGQRSHPAKPSQHVGHHKNPLVISVIYVIVEGLVSNS